MKIGIIGGGAIGLLFAAYLSEDNDVTIYTRTIQQKNLLNDKGLHLIPNGTFACEKIKAQCLEQIMAEQDLVIIAVKQYHLAQILPYIDSIKTPLLFLQNGFSHVDLLEGLATKEIYLGVVEHGALRHNLNTVEHTGLGLTKIAVYRGTFHKIEFLFKTINERFGFQKSNDYKQMLTEKLMVNAIINPLTAILGARNGDLLENPFYYRLFMELFGEIIDILELKPAALYKEKLEKICMSTAANRSSMLKDLENGRPTEIDAILGCILGLAKTKQLNHQLTGTVYTMVKGKECGEVK
jgi:2-dehydropantoate 2-reductase